ncbi:hypothetical protein HAU32_10220 [Weissella confusa]|uniref:Uncharacterized protein n=1 Tax=Weissella fermenti TaxID=2987699 RepID=A0ABT6D662_9LACO|nr:MULTISPECIES: hypothetical protein [Weissella]MBJ7689319.1 hypothetical protein [Weissella confusa]MDF9301015.1 hypothetical protein [Weissella sp. BK2]
MDREKLIARFESIAGSNDPVDSLVAFIKSHDVAEVPSMFADVPEMFDEGEFTKSVYQAVQSQYDARAEIELEVALTLTTSFMSNFDGRQFTALYKTAKPEILKHSPITDYWYRL